MTKKAGPWLVVSVLALATSKGLVFEPIGEIEIDDWHKAVKQANRLQSDFDRDCDPVRVYVYPHNDPIPATAALRGTIENG